MHPPQSAYIRSTGELRATCVQGTSAIAWEEKGIIKLFSGFKICLSFLYSILAY